MDGAADIGTGFDHRQMDSRRFFRAGRSAPAQRARGMSAQIKEIVVAIPLCPRAAIPARLRQSPFPLELVQSHRLSSFPARDGPLLWSGRQGLRGSPYHLASVAKLFKKYKRGRWCIMAAGSFVAQGIGEVR